MTYTRRTRLGMHTRRIVHVRYRPVSQYQSTIIEECYYKVCFAMEYLQDWLLANAGCWRGHNTQGWPARLRETCQPHKGGGGLKSQDVLMEGGETRNRLAIPPMENPIIWVDMTTNHWSICGIIRTISSIERETDMRSWISGCSTLVAQRLCQLRRQSPRQRQPWS